MTGFGIQNKAMDPTGIHCGKRKAEEQSHSIESLTGSEGYLATVSVESSSIHPSALHAAGLKTWLSV